MNHNKDVVVFTLTSTFLFFTYSLYITYSQSTSFSLNKISIVSDLFVQKQDFVKDTETPSINAFVAAQPITTNENNPKIPVIAKGISTNYTQEGTLAIQAKTSSKVFENYQLAKTITNFNKDTSKPSLPSFMQKLVELKNGKKQKVRIAWFGDSMIEGDLLTKTFRKRMQQNFGGYGVGFVPATSITAPYRNTVTHKWKGDWKEENFKSTTATMPLYLSGHSFCTGGGELDLIDKTVTDTAQLLEKSLICGAIDGVIDVTVNGQVKQYRADKKVNRLVLDTTKNHNIEVYVHNNKLPVYGITLEPQSGVVVDNFSFRGITGLELGKLDSTMLGTLETENNYDLVVLEYGANLMFRPDDMDYSWYKKHIISVVTKLQKAMPHTEFLIISTADRAFRYDNTWKTAVGISNLIKAQAELAYKNEAAFYNMYASMGGQGTIVHWAESTPALANKDYIHPNILGADLLGNMLYDAFMKDFRKAVRL